MQCTNIVYLSDSRMLNHLYIALTKQRFLNLPLKSCVQLMNMGLCVGGNAYMSLGSWLSLWNYETIRGSLMGLEWPTLASQDQKTCTLYNFSSLVYSLRLKDKLLKNIFDFSKIFLLTVPRRYFFCGSFMYFCLVFVMLLCASVY